VAAPDFLRINLDALAAVQPDSARGGRSDVVRLVDGSWRIVDGDRSMAIHSRDPQREADRTAAELLGDGAPPAVIVAVGLGLGFLLDALERRQWSGTVLALEPEPGTIEPLLSRRDWTAWIREGRLRLLVAPDFTGASNCWSLFGDGTVEPAVFVSPVLARLRVEQVERAHALVRRLRFDAKANTDARRDHGASYLLNTLSNLRALATEGDVSALTHASPGMPAILVGAGPSLDDVLPALRDAQNSALIISVDTALRPLLAAGISPHVVVAVDPGEANTRHLWDLPPCPDTYLVTEASVDPHGLEHFKGHTFLFSVSDHEPWPWLRAHGQSRGRLRAWGSVLTSAFDLALRMGCDPIVFTGADLAYPGGRLYCSGVAFEQLWRRLAEWSVPYETQFRDALAARAAVEEPDVNGLPVRTASHLVAVRDWLVEQIGREPGRRFVNAGGAGILHGATVQQSTLAAVVKTLAKPSTEPGQLVRSRYRPAKSGSLLDAAQALVGAAPNGHPDPASEEVLTRWERFANGLTRDRIIDTLRYALDQTARGHEMPSPTAARAGLYLDPPWLLSLVNQVPLEWMPIHPVKMEPFKPGMRLFLFRTTTARVMACVFGLPEGAVAENGRPLRRGTSVETLAPGEYFIWRDEVHFASTDGSDPRHNHRTYSLLVPKPVAHLERLPLADILKHHV
jgi:hypothetical protein